MPVWNHVPACFEGNYGYLQLWLQRVFYTASTNHDAPNSDPSPLRQWLVGEVDHAHRVVVGTGWDP